MEFDKNIFRWDSYSDQPATIGNRSKRKLRLHGLPDEVKKWPNLLRLPRYLLKTKLTERSFVAYRNDHIIGLCINLEKPLEGKRVLTAPEILKLIESLELRRISIRIPLHDLDRLDEYVKFIGHFSKYEILVVILQDREFIEDEEKLERALRRIFSSLSATVRRFQIGNAVNRVKWGFISPREYFEFYRVAWKLRNNEFPDLELLGGAVIDFELQDHLVSLFNRFHYEYDGYASLLYVDRRGAPENRQLGFDLCDKIDLLSRLAERSKKINVGGREALWITEVNWPLVDTERFSPSIGDSQVGEVEQLRYLVRYFLLALGSGSVGACYWHQLVAPGYGLIDNRQDGVRKRPAFYGFETLCRLFNGATIKEFRVQRELGYFLLVADRDGVEIRALWCCGRHACIEMPENKKAIGIEGKTLAIETGEKLEIGESVLYLVDE